MLGRPRPTFQEPLRATTVDNEVVILGPGPIHGAFSLEAARRSATILAEAIEACERTAAGEPKEP